MYPIPDHLRPYMRLMGDHNSEFQAEGLIQCQCGHSLFTPYVNEAGTIAAARCHACKAKLLLFHAGRHGWDAFVAKADYLYDLSSRIQPLEACPACGERTALGIKLLITSSGKQDFIDNSELSDEAGKPLREEDWVNAFDALRMDVICPLCGKTTSSILDIETA